MGIIRYPKCGHVSSIGCVSSHTRHSLIPLLLLAAVSGTVSLPKPQIESPLQHEHHRQLRGLKKEESSSSSRRYPRIETHEAARKDAPASVHPVAQNKTKKILFHGGGVLVGTIRVHLIYYGNWGGKPSAPIENFVQSLSNDSSTPKASGLTRATDWWDLTRAYHNGKGKYPGKVVLGSRTFDKYSQGKDLTYKVGSVVYRAITETKSLPCDNNGVYMVLPSADVTESPKNGFCAGTYPFVGTPVGYCGWHWYFNEPETGVIPYAFIGNANQCKKRCGQQQDKEVTPNGDIGIDAMVNILAHELTEAVTDIDAVSGWYFTDGNENADMCNRMFGKMSVSEDKSYYYNMVGQGGMRFLVQQMWDLKTSSCRMQKGNLARLKKVVW